MTSLSEYQRKREPASDGISEDAAAARFAQLHGGGFAYCHSAGVWRRFDGSIWQTEEAQFPLHLARELARELASKSSEPTKRSTGKVAFAKGIETFARADPVFARTASQWDRDPFLLGAPGCTIDLRTGETRAPDPEDGITRAVAVAPSPTPDCPRWDKFVWEAANGDPQLVRFMRQWAGYALTGDVREHTLVFVFGQGGNGKSVFLNTAASVMGTYAVTAAMDTFEASRGDRHPTDLAMLHGARLVTASETEEGKAWAEARIKALTGGDPISARFMRRDFFTFQPTFKLTIIGNHRPVLGNVDDAARRRFCIVPFTNTPATPDRRLSEALREEWPAILRWMIEGCLDWQQNGLVRPSIVTASTEEYFSEQDVFGQWLDECCDVEIGNEFKWEATRDLFASWTDFAESSGEQSGSAKAFSEQMRRRGFVADRGAKGVRRFRFVRIQQR